MADIKHAIWYFTNGGPTYGILAVIAMVEGALANPGYVPTTGEVLAIICLPTDSGVQNSIIELVVPPQEQGPGLSPGY
jgi:hypothetical protein